MGAGNCPICNSNSELDLHGKLGPPTWNIKCPRCGEYSINDLAKDRIERALQMQEADIVHFLSMGDGSDQRADIALVIEIAKKATDQRRMHIPRSIISHVVRKRVDKRTELTSDILAGILKNNSLPTLAEQANNFIAYLGQRLSSPGDTYGAFAEQNSQGNVYGLLGLKTGTEEWKDFEFIIAALEGQKILNVKYKTVQTSDRSQVSSPWYTSLTLDGWQR
jgi:hypothetical protein